MFSKITWVLAEYSATVIHYVWSNCNCLHGKEGKLVTDGTGCQKHKGHR